MDLKQRRLTAEEWNSLEIPVSKQELKILKLIHNGYEDVNTSFNESRSMINFIKITGDIDLTTLHHTNNDAYTIILELKKSY